MLKSSNLCDRADVKIAPTEIMSTLGNGGKKHTGKKRFFPPIDQLALGRKQHQNDSSDFLCCPVIEVEALLIRSYFMCEHTCIDPLTG